MSENREIPLSVYATAWDYASEINHGDDNHAFNVRDIIAKAIMGERERCAEIAKAYLEDLAGCDLNDDEPERIAAAIKDITDGQ